MLRKFNDPVIQSAQHETPLKNNKSAIRSIVYRLFQADASGHLKQEKSYASGHLKREKNYASGHLKREKNYASGHLMRTKIIQSQKSAFKMNLSLFGIVQCLKAIKNEQICSNEKHGEYQ